MLGPLDTPRVDFEPSEQPPSPISGVGGARLLGPAHRIRRPDRRQRSWAPGNPINAAFAATDFQVADQAFQLQEPVLRDRLHVLLRIDPEKTGPARRILPVRKQDMDFPMSWIRRQGAGRVFYTGLGHGAEVFSNPQILQHLLAGIQYALGDLSADDSPDGTRRR
jgi:hypothetical protein